VPALFVPGADPGPPTKRAYEELRCYAEGRTGCVTRRQSIFALTCRRDGADSETRVGEADPQRGQTVLAIFANKDGYTIVWHGGHANVTRKQTYEAIPFD
jgi:hypothetical protein